MGPHFLNCPDKSRRIEARLLQLFLLFPPSPNTLLYCRCIEAEEETTGLQKQSQLQIKSPRSQRNPSLCLQVERKADPIHRRFHRRRGHLPVDALARAARSPPRRLPKAASTCPCRPVALSILKAPVSRVEVSWPLPHPNNNDEEAWAAPSPRNLPVDLRHLVSLGTMSRSEVPEPPNLRPVSV